MWACMQVPYRELQTHCNLWRNWVDIQSSWASLASILTHWAEASQCSEGFTEVAGPGAWNDPDMLIIGNEVLPEYPGCQQCYRVMPATHHRSEHASRRVGQLTPALCYVTGHHR